MKLMWPPSIQYILSWSKFCFYAYLCDLVTLTFWSWSTWWCDCRPAWSTRVWSGYDLPFQSQDDYNFPLTAPAWSSNYYGILGAGKYGVKFYLSSPRKVTTLARTMYNDIVRDGASKVAKKEKGQCVNLICPDHPRRRSPLKFCMRGLYCPGGSYSIHFKFHESRLRVSEPWVSKVAISHWL